LGQDPTTSLNIKFLEIHFHFTHDVETAYNNTTNLKRTIMNEVDKKKRP